MLLKSQHSTVHIPLFEQQVRGIVIASLHNRNIHGISSNLTTICNPGRINLGSAHGVIWRLLRLSSARRCAARSNGTEPAVYIQIVIHLPLFNLLEFIIELFNHAPEHLHFFLQNLHLIVTVTAGGNSCGRSHNYRGFRISRGRRAT